ncbi:MAG: ABC transporter substrate-binding protein [Candidatus Limnocylindria bacterium]
MRSSPRARMGRTLTAIGLVAALLIPVAGTATAQTSNVLRVGTGQDLDSMNPYQTALVVGFEVFTLNYELLVGFGQQLEPVPGFVDSWTANDAGDEYTFKIAADKLWSDGTPATSEDARFSLQLLLDAVASDAGALCLGYIDPYLTNAAVSAVSAPDPQTLVVTLDRPNDRILSTYVPIIPAHIWADKAATICDDQFDPPIVGSGPYQAQEWQTGQFVRFTKNPNFRTELAADEIVMQFFETEDTMAQALRNGELDYAQNLLSDQFDQLASDPAITTVAGTANGFTELGFNAYGTTGRTIEGGGPSTPALADAAFRDALGYAIDKELLVDRVLGGYGEVGTTQVPPFQTKWHTPPASPRTFDLAMAAQKLEAAGYVLDGQGRRLDKEGNPIVLDLVFPDSDTTYATSAEFITTWWADLGISVNSAQYDSDTLIDLMLPPEADPEADYKADYDLFIWGWAGDVDPNSLLEILTCDQIGGSSDSLYCNPRYDELFVEQNEATTPEARKAAIDEMQQIFYDEAPYHILYYDAALHAYRSDRFTNWVNQPDEGTPLFGYGPYGYTQLQLAGSAEPSATPAATDGTAPTAAPSAEPTTPGTTGDSTPLLIVVIAVVILAVVGLVLVRRRRSAALGDE